MVGESWFFRDPQVFEYVAGSATARAAVPGRGPVRILCIPCAGGEEPYSVAMALLDAGLEPGQFVIDAVGFLRSLWFPEFFERAWPALAIFHRNSHIATDLGEIKCCSESQVVICQRETACDRWSFRVILILTGSALGRTRGVHALVKPRTLCSVFA